ncbi:hypothetical protein [Rhodovulum euryhalinum]|uniref:Uncharacterized protein n=1 Tax=Rhodovulum euryhalinum TaxID=35805 RepID=A0A4R2KI08_9RHOB|nr:hypothetical protein [Rhodovulum euryhalinum]TCO73481.1 hypothetical protein EV655_102246 [Rhodovulum euryhalinum]
MGRRRKLWLLAIGLALPGLVALGRHMDLGDPISVGEPAHRSASLSGLEPLAARAGGLPTLPDDPAGPAVLHPIPVRLAIGTDDLVTGAQLAMPAYGVSGLPCRPSLVATPIGAAVVRLVLSAPCRPGSRVTVHHDLISFTERTDQLGLLSVELPAMTPTAAFLAEFDDGVTVRDTVSVPAAAGLTRAALITRGDSGMHLHAFEAGAGFGGGGHVWADAPRGDGAAGTIRILGDPAVENGHRVQIYTAPAATPVPRLSVEVEVTRANCGRRVEAETVLPDADGRMGTGVVTFTLPGCESVGEFLVLKNLPQGRKLATN